jgi:hypothetical protein
MKELTNNTGFTPTIGHLIVEAFMRPQKGKIVLINRQEQEAPPDMQVFVLEHQGSDEWHNHNVSEIKPGTEIIARPGGQLEFLLPRYVYIIPETDVVAIENLVARN